MKPQLMRSVTSSATRLGALLLFVLVFLLAGCFPVGGEMGARHPDPNTALSAALGPTGWLGNLHQLTLHDLISAPDATVALYSAPNPGRRGWAVGVADAKHDWRGWYAHGTIGVLAPPAPKTDLSCVQMTVPAGGLRWLVIAGRFDPHRIAAVEVAYADSSVSPAWLRDDLFTAMKDTPLDLHAVRAFDAIGQLVAEVSGADCPVP